MASYIAEWLLNAALVGLGFAVGWWVKPNFWSHSYSFKSEDEGLDCLLQDIDKAISRARLVEMDLELTRRMEENKQLFGI